MGWEAYCTSQTRALELGELKSPLMGSIFISHSSHDNRAAAELKQQLATWGYASVFLDFDPEDGIPAGRDWERELYHQLRTCGVVLVLCSPRSMASYWCFAEITHAKALGKHVVPVKVADCEVHPILADLQVLDLASDPESTARLQSTLRKALGEGFPWPEERSPYPGLAALQEQDAAIFFGREAEVRESLETLERLRRYRGGRALMVLGASGSGKSSLLRAGLLPRLRRAADRWLIVGPFRPLDDPWRELAIALHRAGHDDVAPAEAARRPKSWRQLHRELDLAANGAMPSAQPLLEVLRDLRLAAGGDAVTVLLVIDQAEELLQHSADRAQGRFAALLQTVLDAPSSPLCCLGTLRADLLTDFQNAAATRDLSFDIQRIGPLTTEGLAEVIAGPARIAGIDLEEGLRERMLADAQDDHALPLLAFALRELYQRFGRDRRLTIREYRDELGGLGGSVAKAAEAALAGDALEPRILNPLQDAMLALVQLTETGRYARRPLPRSEIPPDVIPVIDRFVDARLLTERRLNDAHLDPGEGRDRAIEVTHEMLFESWDRLRTWLDEDRELLLWRKRLDAARREWQRNARHPALLLDGPALAEGERWLEQRGGRLEAGERGFLKYSLQRAAGRRQRRLAAITTALALLAMLAVGGLALWQRAEAQRGRAEDAARVAVAGEFLSTDPTRAAQVLLEVKDPARAPFATARMRQALAHQLAEHQLVGHSGTVGAAAFSPDGRWLATASWDQTVRLWPLEATAELVELSGQTEIPTALRFSRDGDHLLTLADDGSVRVWSTSIAALPTTLDHPARCLDVSFGPRGEQVLAVTADGMAHVWRLGEEARAVTLGGPDLFVVAAAFGPEGERLLTLAQSGAVHAWKTRDGSRPTLIATGASPRLARFSP
ncbi:MAG: TIR domain-containing protein, partial [Acidobacteriota bacterium]